MTELDTFTGRRRAALDALVTAPSVSSAAREAGLSRQTLYGYLADPDFAAAYEQRCREVHALSQSMAQAAAVRAVEVMYELLVDEDVPPSVRLKAASELKVAARDDVLLQAQRALAETRSRA